MKHLYLLSATLLLFTFTAPAQQFSWIGEFPMRYNMNPGMPISQITALPNGNTVGFRVDSSAVIYGSDIYGLQLLECRDGNGTLLWELPFGPEAHLRHVISDGNGNCVLNGYFMDTLLLGVNDTLYNTLGGLWTNIFLASIDPNGQVNWKRNLTRENPDAYEVGCLARHPDGSVWYAHSDFSKSVICRLDANGNEQRVDSVSGIRLLSGLAIDPFGNRYLSGANESGTLTVNNLSISAITSYGQFVARVRADGTAHWAYSGNDITFQRPEVVAGDDGSVALSCAVFDSITWGNISLPSPGNSQTFYLVHADSTGFFTWGRQMPVGADPFSYLQPLAQHYLSRLSDGTIVLIGNQRATVDWGNGVVLSSGSSFSQSTAILYFHPADGSVIHGLIGGSTGYDYTQSLAVGPANEVWFTSTVTDSATYGPFLVNTGEAYRTIVGKVSAPLPSGVSGIAASDAVVFPNPTSDLLWVRGQAPGTSARILSLDGRLLESRQADAGTVFSLQQYPAGVYLLQLINETGVRCLKVIRN